MLLYGKRTSSEQLQPMKNDESISTKSTSEPASESVEASAPTVAPLEPAQQASNPVTVQPGVVTAVPQQPQQQMTVMVRFACALLTC